MSVFRLQFNDVLHETPLLRIWFPIVTAELWSPFHLLCKRREFHIWSAIDIHYLRPSTLIGVWRIRKRQHSKTRIWRPQHFVHCLERFGS